MIARLARVWGTAQAAVGGDDTYLEPTSGRWSGDGRDAPPRPTDIEILDAFEGLGDSCEFAAVQQLGGIDRLALFKWTGAAPARLADILEAELHGLADRSNFHLAVEARAGGPAEYMIHHRMLGCRMHSFESPDDFSEAEMIARQERRLRLLSRKFLDDARAGRRIYLYRSLLARPLAEIEQLHRALTALGPNRLLYVRAPDAELAAGEARLVAPTLCVAALDELATYDASTVIRSRMWPELLRLGHDLLIGTGAESIARE